MSQEKSSISEKTHSIIKEPRQFVVVLHNDDFTTMDFVVMILIDIFFKSFEEAENLMLKVHHMGKAVVGSYSFDIAVSKANKACELAKKEGFPLRITVEPI